MKELLRSLNHQYIGLLALLCLLVGMVASPVLMSIGVIMLTANAVINLKVGELFRQFLRHPVLPGLTAIFFLFALSGLYSEDTHWLVNRLRMKLPFLLMPFAILSIPRFDQRIYFGLLYIFFFIICGICLYLTIWYGLHYEEMTEAYKQGQVLPTPVMHIRFSLMVAFCVVIGSSFLFENWQWKWSWERWLQGGLVLFLILFLHLLAVRSGLVALYFSIIGLLVYFIISRRQYRLGLLLSALLVVGAFTAYQAIPTLKNKINYTLYNLYLIQQNDQLEELSDSYRVATIKAGLAIGNEHPWIGVGAGDVKQATKAYMEVHYPTLADSGFTPQSQYILVYASIGLIGLLLFIGCTTYPLLHNQAWQQPLVLGFHLIALSSFVVEQTLETQLGIAFYLTFLLMGIRYYNNSSRA